MRAARTPEGCLTYAAAACMALGSPTLRRPHNPRVCLTYACKVPVPDSRLPYTTPPAPPEGVQGVRVQGACVACTKQYLGASRPHTRRVLDVRFRGPLDTRFPYTTPPAQPEGVLDDACKVPVLVTRLPYTTPPAQPEACLAYACKVPV